MNQRIRVGDTPRVLLKLVGGPYHGQYLPDKPYSGTLDFTASGQSGWYSHKGYWHKTNNVRQFPQQPSVTAPQQEQ